MTEHADTVRNALQRAPMGFTSWVADEGEPAMDALDALVAERDKIRGAAAWLLANRGHRGEQQAWKLLEDAVGDSE